MSFMTSVVSMIGGAIVGSTVTAPLVKEDNTQKQQLIAQAANCIVSTVVAICLDDYLQKHFDK
ncbi:hypothetical protein pEaSNUABM54_00117 [Erwinia phage pEa_SNUABM_54]|nr:hypothetical protein pEaSNUABM54_00117 [Erwinia phage pEa_SNUABM_54]